MIRAPGDHEMDQVRELFREYQNWLGVDLCFQNFEKELAELPGCYASPRGGILVADDGDGFFGCVAFRPRSVSEAELKRLYVRPDHQGQGFGRALFTAAMVATGRAGYASIVLDTLPMMEAARALYQAYGFREIEPYYRNPEPGVVYLRYVY